jgi:hypothetical protein
MSIHIGVSTRTRGGAVYRRKGKVVRRSIFRRRRTVAALRKMTTRLQSMHPLTAAGGLCAIALLILVQADQTQPTDSVVRPRTMLLHPAAASEGRWRERLQDQAGAAHPAAALARAFAHEKGSERDMLVRELLSGWASRDAGAALNWVSSLEDPAVRRSARATVCLSLAEEDPRNAVVLALAHGADEDDGGGLLECLATQWCEKEPEAALDWALTQPAGEWKNRLVGRASFVLSKSDPVRAAHLVSELEPGSLQDEAVMAVLHQWALKDSSAALEWADAFSEPALRERALAEISNLRHLATSLQEVQ